MSSAPVQVPEAVARAREILKATNSWESCWSQSVTPWDLGEVTPIISELVRNGGLPPGRALIPGCGSGYDVAALATPDRHVVGIDISETAVARARKIASAGPSAKWVEFVCTDFFSYTSASPFDLIFDYTFFCALEPTIRPKWAAKMSELLSPGGELITIIYPVSDHEGGPPYAVSLKSYEEVLNPLNVVNTFYEENALSPSSRKGREFLGKWKKFLT